MLPDEAGRIFNGPAGTLYGLRIGYFLDVLGGQLSKGAGAAQVRMSRNPMPFGSGMLGPVEYRRSRTSLV